MVFEHTSYRAFLRAELATRIQKSDSYSLRAFAKHLGLVPSMLSSVLKAQKNVSAESAFQICRRLKLNKKESEYFHLLVQYESAKSLELKKEIQEKLKKLNSRSCPNSLELDVFRMISDWHHVAILESFTLSKPLCKAEEIADFLGTSKFEVEAAIDRLLRLELIEQVGGSYRKVQENLLIQSIKPNASLRVFHRQMLQMATSAIESQSSKEKCVGSETLSFDPRQLEKANEIIEECFNRVVELSKQSNKRDAIYHLGIQFFKLNKKEQVKS